MLMSCFILASCHRYPSEGVNRIGIVFLNVGYGDGIIVYRNEEGLLIDGGYSICTDMVLNSLRQLKIHSLCGAILTHPHPDHIGALDGVLRSGFPCSKVGGIYPLQDPANPKGFIDLILDRGIEYQVLRRGDSIDWLSGVDIDVLHPDKLVSDMNDSSMVLKVEQSFFSALLTADIGVDSQRELIGIFKHGLTSTILKSPHHGGALDPHFLEMVDPEWVFVSTGINPYGNPKKSTTKLLINSGRSIIRSDISGSVLFENTEQVAPSIGFFDSEINEW